MGIEGKIYLSNHVSRFFWVPEGVIFQGKRTPEAPAKIVELEPNEALRPYICSYWDMSWDLGGKQVPIQVVPSGCVNLVFEANPTQGSLGSKVVGVRENAFSFPITGKNRNLGVQFTPGGFFPFYKKNGSELVDKVLPLSDIFPDSHHQFEEIALSSLSFLEKTKQWDEVFLRYIPKHPPEELQLVHEILAFTVQEEGIKNCNDLLKSFPSMNERKIQRLFQKCVGVSPRMWIRIQRFQDTAKSILEGQAIDWSNLALEMGYYDQAHLINDFRALTGKCPTEILSPRA